MTEQSEAMGWDDALEIVARLHDDEAHRMSAQRDPGMANHHRLWANKVRAMKNNAVTLPSGLRIVTNAE